ncbi:MAG: CpaF/VirB11 family protein [Clostridium tyrobutyricum]|jgi:pilus assembly protein CpaF|uniref:ATPase, T2SS/T4P/T4SS family n=1 Tax=Clostridium tyrobutyricum TaxID=1519 RepID=UPI00164D1FE6|nr:ATPase, T2SS/T4P/T4SS family [Clostridium tyrobutyricum]MCH4236502.1 CpaF/VirB11 family protein [Clostridium tyrobutyricum]MCH4259478.1 CpaF/VirB11 family protein [Clostridium tyrobutyricum]
MNLENLIQSIKDRILSNTSNIESLNSIIEKASAGDLTSKISLKKNIKKQLADCLGNYDVTSLTGYIKQYRLNYLESIYDGNDPDFNRILNCICIKNTVDSCDVDIYLDLLVQIIYQELYGGSIIDPYSYGNMEGLNEININSCDFITFQIKGKKERVKKLFFKNNEELLEIIKKSLSSTNKSDSDLRPNNPEILAENLSGARVTALIPPYSKEPSLNLRYEEYKYVSSQALIKEGTSSEVFEKFIDISMKSRPNIIVVGPQGAGKTTYLMRLISTIPDNLSILTMESSFELAIRKYFLDKDVKSLKFLNIKSPLDCFKTGLRLGRDIIIDGEVRTPEEAYVTLQAMTRQNKGSMGSFHVSSIKNFIPDYKNMLMQSGIYKTEESALYDIGRAVDFVIYIAMDLLSGKRYIKDVMEVIFNPLDYHVPYKLRPLFRYKNNELLPVNTVSKEYLEEAFNYGLTRNDIKELDKLYENFNLKLEV